MNKLIFTILAVILLSSAASAVGWSGIGIKGGINVNTVNGETTEQIFVPYSDYTGKAGTKKGAGGLFVSYKLNSTLSLQADLLFSMKGFVLTQATAPLLAGGKKEVLTFSLDYVEMPVYLKYFFGNDVVAAPSVYLGGSVGKVVRKNVSSAIKYSTGVITLDKILKNRAEFEFGVLSGFETRFPTEFGGIIIDLRYTMSLSDMVEAPNITDVTTDHVYILADSQGGSYITPVAKFAVFSVMVGVVFDLNEYVEEEY